MSKQNSGLLYILAWLMILAVIIIAGLHPKGTIMLIVALLVGAIRLIDKTSTYDARRPRELKEGCIYRYHGTTRQGNLMLTYCWSHFSPNPDRLNPSMIATRQDEEDGVWKPGKVKLPSQLVAGDTYAVLRMGKDHLQLVPCREPMAKVA